ncbi:MAG: SUKH-3 domain-containing protein [Treponema sp.]|nr:SUKH-3 domain-containing protein [Treponema sp.]
MDSRFKNITMTELTLQRLKAAGWTPGRKVDITPIEEAFAKAGMQIPDKLRDFFEEFGFLSIEYDIKHIKNESHYFNPCFDFYNYDKEFFEHFFDDDGIYGTAYPVSSACRNNMTIYYHDDGNFYLFMSPDPLIRCGNTAEGFLDGLIGDGGQDWEYMDD